MYFILRILAKNIWTKISMTKVHGHTIFEATAAQCIRTIWQNARREGMS